MRCKTSRFVLLSIFLAEEVYVANFIDGFGATVKGKFKDGVAESLKGDIFALFELPQQASEHPIGGYLG
jgi:hypothetical protein